MAPGSRRIPNFGAVPDDVQVIDIDKLPESTNIIHADCDEDIKPEIKVEPGINTSSSPAGLGNSILKRKQTAPLPEPMNLEEHHAQQQAFFAQFLASEENEGLEQDPGIFLEPEEQMQNPVEQEWQYLQDKAAYEQKKRDEELSPEDELEFMRKESAYNKRKRDFAALMENEEHEDLLFEPSEVKKPRIARSQPRKGTLRARQQTTLNLRGHANFWENADAAEQMETEPDYEAVEGGRDAGLKVLKEQLRRRQVGNFDFDRLLNAAKCLTNTKGIARYTRGTVQSTTGWTIKGMLTPLKNYQIINCGWMRSQEMRTSEPRGGILADQMGLGKTVTCIANMVNGRPLKTYPPHLRPRSNTTLIIVPSSLLTQWYTEIKRHSVSETPRRKRGLGITRIWKDSDSELHDPNSFKKVDIVLTTYHDVRSSWPAYEIPEGLPETEREAFFMEYIYGKRGPLHRHDFLRVVLDEGHVIANPDTQIAKACFHLIADHKWVLTGTP